MSEFKDIIDGTRPDVDTVRSGLVYTCNCGWLDLGHARPDNVGGLWKIIKDENGEGRVSGRWYRVSFKESMSKWGLSAGESESFAVRRGLSTTDKESVALAIVLRVSFRFENMQSSWPWRLKTDSGFSAEDLVSNLVGFYRAVRPGIPYVTRCLPVSKAAAEGVWKKYGAVGTLKNQSPQPFLFPCADCGPGIRGPMCASLPHFLSGIVPAQEGERYRPWKDELIWDDPDPPLLNVGVPPEHYVVQPGDSLSKIAVRKYGDMFLWPLIFQRNLDAIGANPNLIRPGQRLLLPDLAGFKAVELDEARRRGRNWR
jgi:LysM repeat protein